MHCMYAVYLPRGRRSGGSCWRMVKISRFRLFDLMCLALEMTGGIDTHTG